MDLKKKAFLLYSFTFSVLYIAEFSCGITTDHITIPTSSNCSELEFKCLNDSNPCISQRWKCDDDIDCMDGSDEVNCTPCSDKEFTCGNGRCIPLGWVCDGEKDCHRGSDELASLCQINEKCSYTGVLCSNSTSLCVPYDKLCDEISDCPGHPLFDEGPQCKEAYMPTYAGSRCEHLQCSYRCTMLPDYTPSCYCPDGSFVDPTNKLECVASNACSAWSPCEQGCTKNGGWSYTCTCNDGFYVSPDNPDSCFMKAIEEEPYIIVTSSQQIEKFSLDGIKLSSASTFDSASLDYNLQTGKVCWCKNSSHSTVTSLSCASLTNLSATEDLQLPDGFYSPSHIAIDWLTNNFYFINSLYAARKIFVCKVAEVTVCTTLAHFEATSLLSGLTVDPCAGLLFFSDYGKYPSLQRMGMDGRNLTAVVKFKIIFPKAIALDRIGRRVYFLDADIDYLESVDYDGQHRRSILHSTYRKHLVDMVYFNASLYVTDWNNHSIIKVDAWPSQSVRENDTITSVRKGIMFPSALQVVHPLLQKPVSSHGCSNMTCQYICALGHDDGNSNVGTCLCPPGYSINADGKTCADPPTNQVFLLYSKENPGEIKGTSLSHDNQSTNRPMVPVQNLYNPRAFDFYRDEDGEDWIVVAELAQYDPEIESLFNSPVHNCEGLAIDWVSKNVYWTDNGYNTISLAALPKVKAAKRKTFKSYPNVNRFDPTKFNRKTLVTIERELNMHPRGIAVYPEKGLMYWTAWVPYSGGTGLMNGRIEQAWLDGTHREVFVSDHNMAWPNGITIDYNRDMLYWVEAYHDRIECMYLNKTGRRVLVSEDNPVFRNLISHPFSVAVFENRVQTKSPTSAVGRYLYWTEYREGHIYRLDLDALFSGEDLTRDAVVMMTTDTVPLLHVSVFNPLSKDGTETNNCSASNCSDFCVPIPSHPFYSCLCPDNKILAADNRSCVANSNYTSLSPCSSDYFQCDNGRCIVEKWVCDLDNDCVDNSDEKPEMCRDKICQNNRFKCNSTGICISSQWLCDGDKDCSGGEDEALSTCTDRACGHGSFACPSGFCIPDSWLCDNDPDCPDGADEKRNCTQASCRDDIHFTCNNKRCVLLDWICDEDNDCGDMSDEKDCNPHAPTNSSSLECGDPMEFRCSGGECVMKAWRCDGEEDCLDGSDEDGCPNTTCAAHSRPCATSGDCVFDSWWCDGEPECSDGSDESNCSCPESNYTQIRCLTKSYLHKCAGLCNGIRECYLYDDEANCTNRGTCENAGCSHFCAETPLGFLCSCPKGKELGKDTMTCSDIQYCDLPGRCSQNCTQVPSSYECSCYKGWHIDPRYASRSMCAYDKPDPPPLILYATQHAIKYFHLDKDTSRFETTRKSQLLIGALRHGLVLDFHYDRMLLFYSDVLSDTISKAKVYYDPVDRSLQLNGSEVIVSLGLPTPEGLAVDWLADRIYFVESSLDQIEVVDFDGANRTVVVAGNMDYPRALALDPRYGLMFWTVWDSHDARVERATMSGEGRTPLWNGDAEHSGWPNGLTIDYLEERVYWADAKYDSVWSVKYDGSGKFTAVSNVDWLSHPFSISMFGHDLVWTDWRTTVIASAHKWPGGNSTVLELAHNKPFDVKVFHESRQPLTTKDSDKAVVNPCAHNLCDGLCVISTASSISTLSYKCTCPYTYMLGDDGHSCIPLNSFLLVSYENKIISMRLDNLNYSASASLAEPVVHDPTRIAYDVAGQLIYWSDAREPEIRRAFVNGSGVETVIKPGSDNILGLVVDWIHGNIFWTSYTEATAYTNQTTAHLSVVSADGRFMHRLEGRDSTWRSIRRPRYLTADVIRAKLFFLTDDGVYSCNMDGSSLLQISPPQDIWDLQFLNDSLYFIEAGSVFRLYPSECKGPHWCAENLTIRADKMTIDGDDLWIYDEASESLKQCKLAECSDDRLQITRRNKMSAPTDMTVFDPANQKKPADTFDMPCATDNGGCEQLCLPIPGAFPPSTCKCTIGYTTDPSNPSRCKGLNKFILYSMDHSIRGMHMDGTDDALIPVVDQSSVNGVDFYAENNTIVWVEVWSAIKAATRDMTSQWLIYSPFADTEESDVPRLSPRYFEDVAVDWVAKNVYWTDSGLQEVKVVRLDGRFEYTVFKGGDKPRALAVHPKAGFLFLSDWGSDAFIMRMKLDGSSSIRILESLGRPNGLTIDYDGDLLYWCDAREAKIYSAGLDGGNKEVVFQKDLVRPYGIAFDKGFLYWTDGGRMDGVIASCNTWEDCSEYSLVSQGVTQLVKDVTVFTSRRQNSTNVCAQENGGCEHLCFHLGSNQRRCACSHGRLNGADNTSCLPHDRYIMFSEHTLLHTINVDDPDDVNEPLPIIENSSVIKDVIVMAMDYVNGRIFYSDIVEGSIFAFDTTYNGRTAPFPKRIVKNVHTVEGLAYLSSEDALYWTSYLSKTIMRHFLSSEQPSEPEVVVDRHAEGDHLRALVLYVCERPNLMFWTNWNKSDPSVLRATTNGKNITKIITTRVDTPNGLTIDIVVKQLYWADAEFDKIERCDFDGMNRKVILSEGLDHVFSLAVLGKHLYWSDWRREEIVRVDKWTGHNVTTLKHFSHVRLMGVLAVYNDTCSPNPCEGFDCEYRCVVSDTGDAMCMCPNGTISARCSGSALDCGDDSFNCLLKPPLSQIHPDPFCVNYELTCDGHPDCPNNEDEHPTYCNTRPCRDGYWMCSNNRCIRMHLRCDGMDNCHDEDSSDEQGCQSTNSTAVQSCKNGFFTCTDGSCIPAAWECDNENDCEDGSDEKCDKTCRPGTFQCRSNKKCIPITYQCDSDSDCEDGSDELDCGDQSCKATFFSCTTGSRCIPYSWLCDGEHDCADWSDERSCGVNHDKDWVRCSNDEVQCRTSGKCIKTKWLCDRDNDCPDRGDEIGCEYPQCNGTLCGDGPQCISPEFVCDGDPDCSDRMDERNCTDNSTSVHCDLATHLLCADGQTCIPLSKACDGVPDCPQLVSDENNCDVGECSYPHLHRCTQICVEKRYRYNCSCYSGYQLASDLQSCDDIDECLEANPYPPCSQKCRNLRGSYTCSCASGYYKDHHDPSNCKAGPHTGPPYILFANKYYLREIGLNGTKPVLRIGHLRHAVGLDFDWIGQKLYWSDVTNDRGVIQGMDLGRSISTLDSANGSSNVEGVVTLHKTRVRSVYGIAVDWVARNLYWTDKGLNLIEVSRLDGKYRKILVNSGLDEPRAIVVDPPRGYLYWTDWGAEPHVGRMGMDGSRRSIIINNRILTNHTIHNKWPGKKLGWPNALTIDYASKKLFWADAKEDYIAHCNLDGSAAAILLQRPGGRAVVAHVFSLSLFEDRIYWTDWHDKSLQSAHKFHGSELRTLRASLIHRPMELKVIHPLRQPMPTRPHPCSIYNGDCQDLCLIAPSGYRCECPDNFYLADDRRSCISNCTYSEFSCKTDKCIPFWWKCDGVDDCGDASDEPATCRKFFCVPGQFQCHNSTKNDFRCISPSGICDGRKECLDGSDEINCERHVCLETYFKCSKSSPPVCIPALLRCDGISHCGNGEDEENCQNEVCRESEFKCEADPTSPNRFFNRCLPRSWLCDGEADCRGGEDEKNCTERFCQKNEFRCPSSSGRCISTSWLCDGEDDCPNGSDETDDACKAPQCDSLDFVCDNNRCVPPRYRCDYDDDCGDGSDEADCKPRNCSESEFRCVGDERCIGVIFRCDSELDCADGSDEVNCTAIICNDDQFRCENPVSCIPGRFKCDGTVDCVNGTDEANCKHNVTSPTECPSHMFKCMDGNCIPARWTCDGQMDCQDGSDEGPLCNNIKCTPLRPIKCKNEDICLPLVKLCDGSKDCFDGSDESCPSVSYRGHTSNSSHCVLWRKQPLHDGSEQPKDVDVGFLCPDGSCTPQTTLCDRVANCPDGFDELICLQDNCSSRSCSNIHGGSTCRPLPALAAGGYYRSYCVCDPGLHPHIMLGHVVCVDTDECALFSPCSQICSNTLGGYHCSCHFGWTKHNVAFCRTAEVVGSLPALLVATNYPSRLHSFRDIETVPTLNHTSTFLSLDDIVINKLVATSDGKSVYASDAKHAALYKLDEGRPVLIKQFPVGHVITSIAIDSTASLLYWTDASDAAVNFIKLERSTERSRRTIPEANPHHSVSFNRSNSQLVWPLDVAVIPGTAEVFVSDGGNDTTPPSIHRFNLLDKNNDDSKKIHSDMEWPCSLSVDAMAKRVYWADLKLRTISSAEYDGSRRKVVRIFDGINPDFIQVYGDFVFGSDFKQHRVFRINKLSHTLPSEDTGAYPLLQPSNLHARYHEDNPMVRNGLLWIAHPSNEPQPFTLVHNIETSSHVTAACRGKCDSASSDGVCLPDHDGKHVCMCTSSPSESSRLSPCLCNDVTCPENQVCADGHCACVVGRNCTITKQPLSPTFSTAQIATIAGIAILVVLVALAAALIVYKAKRGRLPSMLFIGGTRSDVGDVIYSELVANESEPIPSATSQLSLATTVTTDLDSDGSIMTSPKHKTATQSGNPVSLSGASYTGNGGSSSESAQLLYGDRFDAGDGETVDDEDVTTV